MAGFGAAEIGGAVDIVYDGEVPRSFTGRADEVLSGGQFVVVTGAENGVGSTMTDFIPGSITLAPISGTVGAFYVNGIALHNAGSNEVVAVATRGTYISTSAGIISGGQRVYAVSGTVQGIGQVPNNSDFSGAQVGVALMPAASGTNIWTLVNFSF